MSILDELEQLRHSLETTQNSPHSIILQQEDTDLVNDYTQAIDIAEQSVERLSRVVDTNNADLGVIDHHVSSIEAFQERSKDQEIAELRRLLSVKEQNLDSLRETSLSNKQTNETKAKRFREKVKGLEEENRELVSNLDEITNAKLEIEERLKEEQTSNKKSFKESNARGKELWNALQKAQEDHEATLEDLKRETHEKERLEVKVRELRRARENETEKDSEISRLRRKLEAEREHFKKAKKWLKAEMKSREDMEHLLLSLKDMVISEPIKTTKDSFNEEKLDVSTQEEDSELEQLRQNFRNQQMHLTREGKHLQRELQSTKKKLSKALKKQKATPIYRV